MNEGEREGKGERVFFFKTVFNQVKKTTSFLPPLASHRRERAILRFLFFFCSQSAGRAGRKLKVMRISIANSVYTQGDKHQITVRLSIRPKHLSQAKERKTTTTTRNDNDSDSGRVYVNCFNNTVERPYNMTPKTDAYYSASSARLSSHLLSSLFIYPFIM